MAVFSLRSILQREIFTPREERLLGVSFVWKASRKSKSAILCAAVSSELPVQVVLVTVKAVRGHYKLSEHWQAAELTLVDGKDVVKETAEFHLHLDKVYKWVSSSVGEKMTFVTCLWKINQRYLQDRVKFINISPAILEEMLPWEQGGAPEEREMMEKEEGYQELTAREADNIDRLMKQSELLVADAKAFTQLLLMELQALDQENLLSLMAVEQRVGSLEELLEQGLAEVELLELAVAEQDGLLRSVQRQMEHLHMRSTWLQRIDRNHSLLESELAYLVDNLTLSENDMQILSEGDLGQPVQVEACSAAVQALTRCAGTPLTPGQRRLQGVAEQLIRFESLRQSFEQRCIMHINSAIIAQAMGNGATLEGRDGLVLPRPTGRHAQLLQYTPLMRWLRETSPATCQHLQKVYTESIGKLYDGQIKDFFDAAKFKVSGVKDTKIFGVVPVFQSSMDRDISSNSLASCTEGVAGRMVQHVLMELREVCMAEEQFLSTFFALDRGEQDNGCSPGAEAPAGTPGCGADPAQASVWPENRRRPCSWFKVSGSSFLAGGSPGDSDCVQGVLGCVEPRLSALISLCLKSEPLSCLKVLKTAGQHLPSALSSPSTSVYCSLLHSSLQLGQQSLQAHTESLCREIESHRVSRKARMGVLPFVCRLEEFVCEGERVLGGEVQRWGLDAAYTQLFSAVFRSLESLSSQSLRTNPLVVKLLNFHRLCHFLSRLGLSGLEAQRDEARRRSAHYLREYITTYLGQPFGTLGEFLCGVRVCLAHGVREEEVCFQLAYSKQELRRAVERCPGRAVRRALETVYSRVSRHLAEDESLLQVVWKAIEEELVAQCRGFEELIQKCYPVARISLDFTVQHLLEYCRPDRQNTQT